jgi:signal transduction histidine kinase/ligand-binding sensor domain-containing protein
MKRVENSRTNLCGMLRRIVVLLALGAATLFSRHLPIQVFGTAQGLPRNFVECMVPGSTGLLWFCTSEGLARFDGYRFRVFGSEDGLPSRTVVNFVPSRKGGFWVVTNRGVCRIAAGSNVGQPCRLLDVDQMQGEFISNGVLESRAGETWFATTTALYRLSADGGRLERATLDVPPRHLIFTIADGYDGSLLVGTNFELFEWKADLGMRNLTESFGPIGVRQLLRVSPDEFWFVFDHDFYRMIRRGTGQAIQRQKIERGGNLSSLIRRRDGTIWSAGWGGIVRLAIGDDGKIRQVERYSEEDGLPYSGVTALSEDAQGDLWGATDGAGVFRILESGFVSYSTKDGLGNARIASVFEDRSGRVVVQPSSWDMGPSILVKEGDGFRLIPIRHPPSITYFGWGWNQYIVPAHDGEWWVSTGQGLLRFPKLARDEDLSRTAPTVYNDRSPLGCLTVFRTFEDSAGDIWISCTDPKQQLTRWERKTGRFQHWSASEGWPEDNMTTVIREAQPGTFWIGTMQSLVRFRNGRFEVFALTSGGSWPGIRDLLLDRAGHLWVASHHLGIFRCDNPNNATPVFRSYTMREGLSSDALSSLVEDDAGFIYAGGARGVDRIDPRAPIVDARIRHFTVAEGLPDSEQNAAFRDHHGHLWFGTLRGLAEFDPAKVVKQSPPEVYLMRLRVRGEDVPLPWEGARTLSFDLAADRNQIEVEYAGVGIHAPESLRYQYRLGGVDHDWSNPVQQLSVNFASLPSGVFHFEVRAVDSEGQSSPKPAGFDVLIQAPLWRRWWFLTTMAVLFAAGVATMYNYRVRQLLAMERLRTRIATDLHDDIGASLTQISILSELARRGSTSQVLLDIANIARGIVSEMSDIVWAVNPRHDRFDELVHRMRRFASDVLGGADIDLNFDTEKLPAAIAVPLEARRPLYLIFKEAVNNVARHSGASETTIRLELDHHQLIMTVEDNGCGFDPQPRYPGEGLASIARRMRNLGGSAVWDSRPGAGTHFTATLPLSPRTSLHELMGPFRRAPLK